MACGSAGVDAIIDLRNQSFAAPFRRLVSVARGSLTCPLPPKSYGLDQLAPPQGEGLGLNLTGIQLVPAEGHPRPVLAHHLSLGQSTACIIEQLSAGICTSGPRDRTRGHRHVFITRLSLPGVTPPTRHIGNPGFGLPGPPAPGKLTLWGWVVTPGPNLSRLEWVGRDECKTP